MTKPAALPRDVAAVVQSYPKDVQARFHEIRRIVLAAAADTPGVGPITETLKWSEPAFLTDASKSGTTIRLAWKASAPDHIGIYLNCRTSLIETVRSIYPNDFLIEGNRALLIAIKTPLPAGPVDHCVRLAQSYHRAPRYST